MDMKEITVKGSVGDKVLIEATITGIRIEENGVTYCVQTEPDADIIELKDSEVREAEKPKVDKVKREKVKSTLGANVPKQPTVPPMPKKRPGRPKKATVEGTMAKLARMKQEETDKALDEMEEARENNATDGTV
jgi:hypothetical protein